MSSDPFFSASWYRVSHLVPALPAHVLFHRHVYRGQIWYVLEDPSSARCHRLTPAAYHVAGLMDGTRTIHEIWESANSTLGDSGPSQDETIRLLGLLHFADALRCDVSPDMLEVLRRYQRREHAAWWQRYANPLSIRVPLLDPDAWLARLAPHLRWLFTRTAAVGACLLLLAGALTAARHWGSLTADASTRLLEPSNLLLMFMVYPAMKALHEFGHAITVRHYGGEVHEMGVLFLVMMPVPYVDASAATVWPEKCQRIAVGAAGVVTELLLASLGLLVWAAVGPGLISNLAFNVAWIGCSSSLLVNGNPLLKFDGYYVLSDALEIPNLRQRSQRFLSWAVLRHAFGVGAARYPVTAPGEAPWFAAYGICSFIYRLVITCTIALFLSQRFFLLGILLAAFSITTQCLLPLARGAVFVATNPRLAERRSRAMGVTVGAVALLAVVAFVIPVPLHTYTQGVVWPPEGAHVRARANGFVVEMLAEPGMQVARGQALMRTRDASLEAELAIEEARLAALKVRHHADLFRDHVRAQIVADEMVAARAAVARVRERVGEVVVRSPAHGKFVVPGWADLNGRFVEQGDLIGYVVGESIATARVVVPQAAAALVQSQTRGVEVRNVVGEPQVWSARVQSAVPAAATRLPSAALGTAAGGLIPVVPSDVDGLTPLDSVFQLDLALPPEALVGGIGARVHVRFDHGLEPVAFRVLRSARRLLLGAARA